MREAHTHRSAMDVDTMFDGVGRGTVLPNERMNRGYPPGRGGLAGRNAFQEPDRFIVGSHGSIGGGDIYNVNDLDGDFDNGPWEGSSDATFQRDAAWNGGS